MAIFTKLKKKDIKNIFLNYDLSPLEEYIPIHQGIQNTNYYTITENSKFILTIFEDKNINKDLQYYLKLLNHLYTKGFNCPYPLINNSGKYFTNFNNKKAAIFSFLQGNSLKNIFPKHLYEVGKTLAKMHYMSLDYNSNKKNDYSFEYIILNIDLLKKDTKIKYPDLYSSVLDDISEFKKLKTFDFSKGIIHADLFPDNILFKDDKINGVIDFYYSCKDYFVIDLAIIIISWCLIYNEKRKISLDENKVKKLLAGYNKIKNIKIIELNSLNIFCKIFCIRFYISRLIDAKQKHDRSIVKTKNPEEYIDKYLYFKNSNLEFTRFF